MSLAEFLKHIRNQGCKDEPLEGVNITGIALKLTNPKNNRRHIFNVYKGGEVSDESVMNICDKLFINYPPNLSEFAKGNI